MTRYCPLCEQRMESAECPTDGVPTVDLALLKPSAEGLLPGRVLARRYQVERAIGEGSMGSVFLATRLGMKSRVALKVLRGEGVVSAAALKRFYQEARAISALDHPNVVRLIDFGLAEDSTLPFLAMEFVEGPTLRDLVLAYGRMPERRATALLAQVAKALVEAHQKGVVHRDLKPANIVVCMLADGDEHVKVLDFGVSKVLSSEDDKKALRLTIPGTALGTPLYMSPEQVSGRDIDFRSDLYSLGCVLHELLTGDPPFLAEHLAAVMQKQLNEPPPPLPPRLADGEAPSADLVRLHDALLAKSKEDRPSSSAVVAWIMGALSRGEQLGAHTLLRRASKPEESSFSELPPVRADSAAPAAARGSVEVTQKTNLGPEISSFVGRERDLAALAELFERGARLVTILGAGGTGKTRLARRFGAGAVDGYSRQGAGVWFADLSEAKDLDGVLTAIAGSLDVPLVGEASEDGVERLGRAIRSHGRLLLILDNFEHVARVAPTTIGRWLEQAPEARFLVTTRERLLIEGEQVHPLSPLAEEEGLELFELRAKAVRPSFQLAAAERQLALEIVRRLDGIPLALELAAARVGVLSVEKLAERLAQSFQVLSGATKNAAPRHRTMRAAIEWSWRLLGPVEQRALAQMAVFAGGFSVEAAEAILDLGSGEEEPPSVLDVLEALRNKSLLRAEESGVAQGELRFGLYDSIREYAAERLDELALRPGAEERHQAHYLAEAEKWAAGASGSRALTSLRLLRLELDNLLAVHKRSAERAPELAARAALALEPMLTTRGPLSTAIVLLDDAVECATRSQDRRLLVRCLLAREHARSEAGAHGPDEALADVNRALELASALRVPRLEGEALLALGRLQLELGRVEESERTLGRAVAALRNAKQRQLEGRALVRLGYVQLEQDRVDEARATLSQGLEITRAVDDRRYEGFVLGTLSTLEHQSGQLGEALLKVERGIAVHRSVGNRRNEGMDLAYLGLLQFELGHLALAKAALIEAREVCHDVGLRKFEGFALAIQGAIAAEEDLVEEAERLFTLAEERVQAVNDQEIIEAVALFRGLAELARARAATGDERRAELARAEARLARAQGLPMAQLGADIRIGQRILKKRIEAVARSPA